MPSARSKPWPLSVPATLAEGRRCSLDEPTTRLYNDQLIASFEFTSEAEAQAAQKKMQEILATCVKAMGYA
jgi:hypothetical protein